MMLRPLAVVDAGFDPAAVDCDGVRLLAVREAGLALVGEADSDGEADPAAVMDIVTCIHERAACVPVRMGEAISDAEGRRLLRGGRLRFRGLLELIGGADEWSVRIDAAGEPAVEESSDAGEAGGVGYLRRRRRELSDRAGLSPAVDRELGRLASEFAGVLRDVRRFASGPRGGTIALLVDRRRAGEVVERFEAAAAGVAGLCTLTGPWPAYSFAAA